MFSYSGNCYLALPAHVAGPLPKVAIYTAEPVVSDQATVQKPFWPEMDLAIAVVDRGVLDTRCTASMADLAQTNRSRTASTARLHRISESGEEERVPLQIIERNYLKIIAELTRNTDTIRQSTSGAFAFVGETPIAMALESDDPSRATFLRADEIAIHLRRYLSSQGFEFRSDLEATSGIAAPGAVQGMAISSVESSLTPTLPQHGPENLLGEGLFIVRPTGVLEVTLRLDTDKPKGLSRLRLTADAAAYAAPKDIIIQTDVSAGGSSFRFWTQGQMTPDGKFDTGPLAARNIRWVRILIRNAWRAGDLGLEQVVLE